MAVSTRTSVVRLPFKPIVSTRHDNPYRGQLHEIPVWNQTANPPRNTVTGQIPVWTTLRHRLRSQACDAPACPQA